MQFPGVFPGILQAVFSAFYVFRSATWRVAGSTCGCDGAFAGARLKLNLRSRISVFSILQPWYSFFRFHASLVFVHILSWFGATNLQNLCIDMLIDPYWSFHASSFFRCNVSYCFLCKADLEHQARLFWCKFYLPITTALFILLKLSLILQSLAIRNVQNFHHCAS